MTRTTRDVTAVITEDEIRRRVQELGQQITADYGGRPLTVVGVLRGSLIFLAGWVRQIAPPLTCDFIEVSRYSGRTDASGIVRIVKDLSDPVEHRDVLLIEDIVDSGLTLAYLRSNLETRRPASVRVCTLLDKPEARQADIVLDYVGFVVPDRFLVGYGLDLEEQYRNLPYVGVIENREEDPP